MDNDMQIAEGCVITFNHKILNTNNELLNTYKRTIPYKAGIMHPKLFEALRGKSINSSTKVHLSMNEVGFYDAEKIISLPRSQLKNHPELKKGMLLKTISNNSLITGHILYFDEKIIKLDLNPYLHTLKQDVIFEVDILAIENNPYASTEGGHHQIVEIILSSGDSISLI